MTIHKCHSMFLLSRLLLVILIVIPSLTFADCLKDGYGEVYCGAGRCLADSTGTAWCSRYYEGDAQRTSNGTVVCGKGQCMKRSDGSVICSSEIGGSVLIDSNGNVRCYGKCEPATLEMCENTRAGM